MISALSKCVIKYLYLCGHIYLMHCIFVWSLIFSVDLVRTYFCFGGSLATRMYGERHAKDQGQSDNLGTGWHQQTKIFGQVGWPIGITLAEFGQVLTVAVQEFCKSRALNFRVAKNPCIFLDLFVPCTAVFNTSHADACSLIKTLVCES